VVKRVSIKYVVNQPIVNCINSPLTLWHS